ncbi:MAG: alanine racemase [Candidatus Limnocylindrales bacterium]
MSELTTIEARLRAAGLPPLPRTAWLEIDLDALRANLATLRALLEPGVRLAAVIKADAYGHGLLPMARAGAGAGADYLCVATLDEGLAVAGASPGVPVLLLYQPPRDGFAAALHAGIQVTVAEPGALETLETDVAAAAREAGRPLRVHLEIDTGLGRAGIAPALAGSAAARLSAMRGVELVGAWSHLASSDAATASGAQVARFEEACAVLGRLDLPPVLRHVAASGGLLGGTAPQYDMVRLGLALYGLLPLDFPVAPAAREAAGALRPVMSLHARPIRVADVAAGEGVGYGSRWRAARPSRVATLPVGYGDGWAYGSAGGTRALVRGRSVPLVGSVAMDAIAADVTEVPGVGLGDEFVLLGEQGSERIGSAELARRRSTIPWEIVTAMAVRLPRVYHAAGAVRSVRTLAGEVRRRDAGAG